jgi:HPt (histidine-containing phosphotransfer) domain-containing protein
MSSNPPAATDAAKASVSEAMARLWAKFLPEIERRVSMLDAAAAALAAGSLAAKERENAHADAHKLAGSLGTFGMHRGTEIARRAELALAVDPVAATAQELAGWVAEIRTLIHARQDIRQ